MPNRMKEAIGTKGQLRSTRAMIKFCKAHQAPSGWVSKLEQIYQALDEKDLENLKTTYSLFRRGGMGSFLDWYPEPTIGTEDEEYAETMLWALSSYWHETMKPIEKA